MDWRSSTRMFRANLMYWEMQAGTSAKICWLISCIVKLRYCRMRPKALAALRERLEGQIAPARFMSFQGMTVLFHLWETPVWGCNWKSYCQNPSLWYMLNRSSWRRGCATKFALKDQAGVVVGRDRGRRDVSNEKGSGFLLPLLGSGWGWGWWQHTSFHCPASRLCQPAIASTCIQGCYPWQSADCKPTLLLICKPKIL